MSNSYGGSNAGKAGLRVREVDGDPNVAGVNDIIVSNGTLTDDGNGTVTLTTGGGGGGGVTQIVAGTNITISPVGGTGAVTINSSGGGGGGSRNTLSGTTASTGSGLSSSVNITGGAGSGCKTYNLFTITTDFDAWVRLYITDAARTADAGRPQGTPPSTTAGVIAEAVVVGGGGSVNFTPGVVGWNGDSPAVNTIYVAVQNNDALSQAITVDIDLFSLEE